MSEHLELRLHDKKGRVEVDHWCCETIYLEVSHGGVTESCVALNADEAMTIANSLLSAARHAIADRVGASNE